VQWRFFNSPVLSAYNHCVLHSSKRRVLGFAVALICSVPFLAADIVEVRQYHGKQVTCHHSGLVAVARSCDIQYYERVLTGTVKSSIEVGDTDKLLEIDPDEVFVGDSSPVKAITNQACLYNEIQTGDKWLFYLYRDSNTFVVPFQSSSKPITVAAGEVSMLRDLVRLRDSTSHTDSGILMGKVARLTGTNDKKFIPLVNHKVIAHNVKDNTKHTAYTNESGYFKFALPPGSYDIAAAPEYGLQEVDTSSSMPGSVPLEKGQCWEHDFTVK